MVEIFVDSAEWWDEGDAFLESTVIYFEVGASVAGSVDKVVSELADAGLSGQIIDLIGSTGSEGACAVDQCIVSITFAGIASEIIYRVIGASVAYVFDDYEAWQAETGSIEAQVLVDSAGVAGRAPLSVRVIGFP